MYIYPLYIIIYHQIQSKVREVDENLQHGTHPLNFHFCGEILSRWTTKMTKDKNAHFYSYLNTKIFFFYREMSSFSDFFDFLWLESQFSGRTTLIDEVPKCVMPPSPDEQPNTSISYIYNIAIMCIFWLLIGWINQHKPKLKGSQDVFGMI